MIVHPFIQTLKRNKWRRHGNHDMTKKPLPRWGEATAIRKGQRRDPSRFSTTALDQQLRSLFLARGSCGTITLLVINNDFGRVRYFCRFAAMRLPRPAALVQRSAHLLHRDLRIFPPAAEPCARR